MSEVTHTSENQQDIPSKSRDCSEEQDRSPATSSTPSSAETIPDKPAETKAVKSNLPRIGLPDSYRHRRRLLSGPQSPEPGSEHSNTTDGSSDHQKHPTVSLSQPRLVSKTLTERAKSSSARLADVLKNPPRFLSRNRTSAQDLNDSSDGAYLVSLNDQSSITQTDSRNSRSVTGSLESGTTEHKGASVSSVGQAGGDSFRLQAQLAHAGIHGKVSTSEGTLLETEPPLEGKSVLFDYDARDETPKSDAKYSVSVLGRTVSVDEGSAAESHSMDQLAGSSSRSMSVGGEEMPFTKTSSTRNISVDGEPVPVIKSTTRSKTTCWEMPNPKSSSTNSMSVDGEDIPVEMSSSERNISADGEERSDPKSLPPRIVSTGIEVMPIQSSLSPRSRELSVRSSLSPRRRPVVEKPPISMSIDRAETPSGRSQRSMSVGGEEKPVTKSTSPRRKQIGGEEILIAKSASPRSMSLGEELPITVSSSPRGKPEGGVDMHVSTSPRSKATDGAEMSIKKSSSPSSMSEEGSTSKLSPRSMSLGGEEPPDSSSPSRRSMSISSEEMPIYKTSASRSKSVSSEETSASKSSSAKSYSKCGRLLDKVGSYPSWRSRRQGATDLDQAMKYSDEEKLRRWFGGTTTTTPAKTDEPVMEPEANVSEDSVQETNLDDVQLEVLFSNMKLADKRPTPLADKQPTPLVDKQPTPLVDKQPAPLVDKQPTPQVDKQPTPQVDKQPTPLVDKQPTPLVDKQPTPLVDKQPTPLLVYQSNAPLSPRREDNVGVPKLDQNTASVSPKKSENVSDAKFYHSSEAASSQRDETVDEAKQDLKHSSVSPVDEAKQDLRHSSVSPRRNENTGETKPPQTEGTSTEGVGDSALVQKDAKEKGSSAEHTYKPKVNLEDAVVYPEHIPENLKFSSTCFFEGEEICITI